MSAPGDDTSPGAGGAPSALEQQLTATLHRVDAYEPSPDLFSALGRSLGEDRRHRRRVRRAAVTAAVGAVAVTGWVGLTAHVGPDGAWRVERWAVEALETLLLGVGLVTLAPLLRRSGQSFVLAAFHLGPDTGRRVLSLLETAYHLTFGGLILLGAEVTALDRPQPVASALGGTLDRLAVFLAAVGAAHALNLLVLPVVGLVFNAGRRRALRAAAGATCPPPSARAVLADRVCTWLLLGAAASALVGVVFLLGAVLGGVD